MTNTTAPRPTANPATPRQISFITDLLAKRDVPESIATALASPATLTTRTASGYITVLLQLPLKPAPVVPAFQTGPGAAPLASPVDEVRTKYFETLRNTPKGKYALKFADFEDAVTGVPAYGNDLLFLEVKEYKNKMYFNRLSGAPGSFSRSRLNYRDGLTLLRIIGIDPVAAMKRFGEHYQVCGRCAAELTDADSRARFFGPECARILGLR